MGYVIYLILYGYIIYLLLATTLVVTSLYYTMQLDGLLMIVYTIIRYYLVLLSTTIRPLPIYPLEEEKRKLD